MLNKDDANQMINKCVESRAGITVHCDSIVASETFLSKLREPFSELMAEKADRACRLWSQNTIECQGISLCKFSVKYFFCILPML